MHANPTSVSSVSPSRRLSAHRFRLAQSLKHMDMKDARVALDIILRPSLQLLKLALGRGGLDTIRRPKKTTLLGDDTSSTSSITIKKKVRFDEKPTTISRRSFLERSKKDPSSSPTRPCLVIRESGGEIETKFPEPSPETDVQSVYEDCLSHHPNFLVDLHVLEGDDHLDTRPPKRSRRSEFYEMESGIAMFDRAGYASYCLSNWIDKKREEARAPKKLVFEDPALLPWPSRTLSLPPPAGDPPDVSRPTLPSPPAPFREPPRSLPWCVCTYIEEELHNAVAVLAIGLFIHICLFAFLVYDVLTRGFLPSDD